MPKYEVKIVGDTLHELAVAVAAIGRWLDERGAVEETPVEETPVEETPVEETPVEETPVGESDTNEADWRAAGKMLMEIHGNGDASAKKAVQSLIQRFGVEKFTAIPHERGSELLAAVVDLKDGLA